MENLKQMIKEYGMYNKWRGCAGLYFTTAQLRSLKKYGITKEMPIHEAYNILTNMAD
nr:MAG TPA: hypothetical protein [Caudoviricetes sp.]